VRCKGIDGILSEGNELIGNSDGRSVIEAAVIASAQAVEHYEITRYGDLIAWAREMGRNDLIKPLRANLREEKAADLKLTQVAEGKINKKADKTQRRGTKRARTKSRSSAAAAAA
jgi:ferritin-like metal-binding protein YciE